MNGTRKPKKSETLEVRLPHRVKHSLMEKAHAEGRSASEVVRDCIDSYLAGQPKESRSMLISLWKPAAVLGAGSLAFLWAAAVPVPSQAKPNLKAVFETLDRDHDGKITIDEFMRNASDPAVEKMHHAHMTGADKAYFGPMHAQMMKTAHSKTSDQGLRAHFAQLDANSDGAVSLAEFRGFHDKMMASHPKH
jgi:hypothetical protein